MQHHFTRQELFDLVWSAPMREVAARFHFSDVALGKICKRYDVPIPYRGYWAKLRAGKSVVKASLPTRKPGMTDAITIGQSEWRGREIDDLEAAADVIPPAPQFPEPLEDLSLRIASLVGKVTLSRDLKQPCPVVARLLRDDEARVEKANVQMYPSSFDRLWFASPYERRRLRILNSIFAALGRLGMRGSAQGKNPSDFGVDVNGTYVSFRLDDPSVNERTHWPSASELQRSGSHNLCLRIEASHTDKKGPPPLEWRDAPDALIEQSLREIVVALIVTGERKVRASAAHAHQWRIERKASAIKAIKEREEEALRKEQERIQRLRQATLDKLLSEAAALRFANDIRSYVQAVAVANVESQEPVAADEFSAWAAWALIEASRIDPVLSKAFLQPIKDPSDPDASQRQERELQGANEKARLARPWHPNQKWYAR